MIIACGEWGLRELEMEDHFRFCEKFGFNFMEIGIGGDEKGRLSLDMDKAQVSTFLNMKNSYGIEAPYCMLENDFTFHDEEEHNKQVVSTINALHLAKKLNTKIVRLFAGFTPADELNESIWQRLLSALNDCQKICKELNLEIAVETHGKIVVKDNIFYHIQTVSTDRDCLKRLVKEMPEGIGFCYDPGNMRAVDPDDTRYGLDIINDRINYCHLKDWKTKGDGWYPAAPGDDSLDYSALLPKINYNGPYAIEYEPTEDVEDGFRRSIDYLKRIGQVIE